MAFWTITKWWPKFYIFLLNDPYHIFSCIFTIHNVLEFCFDVPYLYLQAMRIPCPQTQGIPQTIMGPPHRVLSSGGSILYPIQISQSGPSLMTGGPVVISQTGQQVPPAGSMIISHPAQHQPQGPQMVVSQTSQHPQAIPGNLTYHGRFQWPIITAQ